MSYITVKAPPGGRTAYAVLPDPDDPVILQLDGRLVRVLDISASGVSVPLESVAPGRRYPFSLDLPSARIPIGGYIDVLPDDAAGFLTGRFVELAPDELDALHHYVLIRQKEAIRSLRAARGG